VTGAVFPIRASLIQEHDAYSGTTTLFENPTQSGAITGKVNDSNQLTLAGRLAGDSITSEFVSWSSTFDSNGMTGQFALDQRFGNAFGQQILIYQCEILSLRR